MAVSDTAETVPGSDTEIGLLAAVPVAVPEPESVPAPRPVGSARFVPQLLGGALAAALGFGAAYYLAGAFPQALGISGTAGIDQRLSDHDKRLTDLAAALTAAQGGGEAGATAALRADLEAESKRSAELQQQQEALAGQLAALTEKLQKLENAPLVAGGASAADIAAATDAAAQRAKAAEEQAVQAQAQAAAALRQAALRTALGELRAALESGAAMDKALGQLDQAGVAAPEALTSQAQGVPTLAALRGGFPPAARDALAASLAETAGGSLWNRAVAFVRSETGARSLTPRAGADPDAILSRAEAALGAGDLVAALAEIATLPATGQARMAEWKGLAERRLGAAEAIAALAAEIE